MDKNSKLVQVSHESSLYISPKGKVEGVFIEYLSKNFVEHNPVYRAFVKQFTKPLEGHTYTIGNKKKAEKYLLALGEALRADIYQDAKEYKQDLNIDALMNFALAS